MLYPTYTSRLLRGVARSMTLIFVLISLPPSVCYANLTVMSATPTSVTLTWTAPGDDGNIGTASLYDIRYSNSPVDESNWDQATQITGEPSPQAAGSSESFDVTGLDPGTAYYFAIKTADEVSNWSPISNVISKSTESEQDAPANIADLSMADRTQTSILLGWTAPGDDGATGTASTYDLRYWNTTITEINWDSAVHVTNEPTPSVAGTPETCTVSDLNENTNYFFAIKTADEIPNWSGLSNVVSTSTLADETPPAAIEDLQASSGNDQGEIDLSWTAPGDDGILGTATSYEIRYSLNSITQQNFNSATLCLASPDPAPCGDEQSHTLCELNPGEMYYVAMLTYDESGNPSSLSNIDTAIAYFSFISDIDDDTDLLPDHFELRQNYPNPFNPQTEIRFSLPEHSYVNLSIFNTAGQRVATLIDRSMSAGEHVARWSGIGDNGRNVATGVYFYRLLAEDFSDSKKMVLLK